METAQKPCFKDFNVPKINPGDLIRVTPVSSGGMRQIEMAVLGVLDTTNTSLLVLLSRSDARRNESPMMELEAFQIASLEVMMKAETAVPYHSGEKNSSRVSASSFERRGIPLEEK